MASDLQPTKLAPANHLAADALGFLKPKETRRAAKARGPRRLVMALRFGLPVIALLVVIALMTWPLIDPHKLIAVALKNAPDLVIRNLHFNGFDSKNQPYSLTAQSATRPAGQDNLYDLDKPAAEMTLTSGNWVSGKADYGRFEQSTRRLWLGGNVQMFHDKGYQFTSDEAQVDINGNFAYGDKPVLIQGDFGEIRGQGFRLLDSGTTMIIKGPATARLSLRGGAPSDTPAAVAATAKP